MDVSIRLKDTVSCMKHNKGGTHTRQDWALACSSTLFHDTFDIVQSQSLLCC